MKSVIDIKCTQIKAMTKTDGKYKAHRERAAAEKPFTENSVVSLPSFAPKAK